ncbi:dual specificity mitogen-activated protein kinase kinase dSOR1 [Apiospora rasikravindrae]|uniref:mitogen-activated protein kinase kinase n=1 Tax=Apiospora rasikravindrae TaxID=990691 RepID=A0ABR1TBY7_9PEZI
MADTPSPPGSPLDTPDTPGPDEFISSDDTIPKRMPSLRSISDPQNPGQSMSASSTPLGVLSNARRPPVSTGMSSGRLPDDINAKMRAFHLSRQGSNPMAPTTPSSAPPQSPTAAGTAGVPVMGGLPGGLRPPGGLQRPGAPSFPKSAPSLPPSAGGGLAGKRRFGLKLGDMGGGGGPATAAAPSLGGAGNPAAPANNASTGAPSQMSQFANYIDTEKGYLTFKGKAIISNKGVDFSDGTVFRISLDEVEKLDELGKGNYGTVYKVRHSKPRMPRFGQGLSGFKSASNSALPATTSEQDDAPPVGGGSVSGKVMAMKEMRLELDEAKFGTILKELLILHECVSPYIIDFYGAFFQEGAVYMCLEYMDGGSIDKLYTGGIPESILQKITYSTVMGLKELKEKHNIIHRDVKPTNILANSRGQIKICDFGVSGNLVASMARTNIGCQSYMAPERISGGAFMTSGASDGTYSVQSDIWSLGLTVIECAMGKYPYPPEVSSTIFSQLSAIVEGDPPDLPEVGYSDTARKFVHACLHKVPKMRPTYGALLASDWLQGLAKPETITEEDEEAAENDASDQAITDAVDKLKLGKSGTTEDAEIAAWVQGVLSGKDGNVSKSSKPALHTAPLDTVSPMASPQTSS